MKKDLYETIFGTRLGLEFALGLAETFDELIKSISEYNEEDKTENTNIKTSTSKQVNVAGYSKQDINVSVKNKTLLLVNVNPYKSKLEVEIDIPRYTKSIDIEIENGMATINFIPSPKQSIEINIK